MPIPAIPGVIFMAAGLSHCLSAATPKARASSLMRVGTRYRTRHMVSRPRSANSRPRLKPGTQDSVEGEANGC